MELHLLHLLIFFLTQESSNQLAILANIETFESRILVKYCNARGLEHEIHVEVTTKWKRSSRRYGRLHRTVQG